MDTYCACEYARYTRRGKIELKYPSDGLGLIVEYLNDRYEVVGFAECEDEGEATLGLKFRGECYDNEKGYIMLMDPWGNTFFEVRVNFESDTIYWSWVERWGEEIFELHFLSRFDEYFEWRWRDNKPGVAAKVWNKMNLLKAYREHRDRCGGAWRRRYAELLAEMLLEEHED